MVSGIYSAEFASNQNVMGRGVVIFTESTLHGGDEAYYYKGKFKREGNNNISAAVDVGNHSGNPTSIFGPLNSYRLTLNGVSNNQGFTLSGQVEGRPTLMITIKLKKVDELVEG
jgi:hypothetical protein